MSPGAGGPDRGPGFAGRARPKSRIDERRFSHWTGTNHHQMEFPAFPMTVFVDHHEPRPIHASPQSAPWELYARRPAGVSLEKPGTGMRGAGSHKVAMDGMEVNPAPPA